MNGYVWEITSYGWCIVDLFNGFAKPYLFEMDDNLWTYEILLVCFTATYVRVTYICDVKEDGEKKIVWKPLMVVL